MATSTLSTTTVTLHTSSATFLETTQEPDAQMTALQQMFELLGASDAMVIEESDRTREAAQRAFDKLLQDFQRVSQENDSLRLQTIQLTGQFSQLNRVHEAQTHALQQQVRLAEQRNLATQLQMDETLRQCQENVSTATRRQLEAVQTAQDTARAQTGNLESSHRAQIEALTSAHTSQIATCQRTISDLQNQLNEARANHQTAIAQKEQTVQSLTAELTQTQSQLQSLQNKWKAVEPILYDRGIRAIWCLGGGEFPIP